MYTLDGRQKKALHAALRNAFPRPAALERLVEFHLDEQLALIAGEGALDDVIFRVIAWAEAQGRLDALVNGARAEAPGNPQLIAFERTIVEAGDARPQDATLHQFAERLHLAPGLPNEPDLEKRVFRAGFSDIAQWRARLGQAERAVCRIEAPAWRALGTGFLVGPDLVMTNRHVVEAMASQAAPPLLVRFDFKLSPDGTRLREGQTFDIAHDWLVASSPVAQLDFAVLRLAEPAGLRPTGGTLNAPSRGWITPRWRDLESDETIFVIQHPQGDTLKLASGRYDSREPTRLRYRVDTEPGSSGSPCFTAQMELVALHRGSAEGLANQGVPFDAIGEALPTGFFPPARPETSAIDATGSVAAMVASVDAAARADTESTQPSRRRRSPALMAAGVAAVIGLAAVLLWWTRVEVPAAMSSPADPAAASAKAQVPPATRRPVREVQVPFSEARGSDDQCKSDQGQQRALFRLQSTGPWPAPTGLRSREVQLFVLGEVEIEYASIAMVGAADPVAVSQPNRDVARKWLFAEPVTSPFCRRLRTVEDAVTTRTDVPYQHLEGGRTMTPVRVAAIAVVSLTLWGCRDAPPSPGASGSAPVEGLVEAQGGADAGSGPTAVLYGRVIGSDHQPPSPPDWQVRVTAEYEDGTDVAPRDRDSTGDLFAFKVVPGKRVRLYFEAVPYQASVTEFLDVNDERRYASRVPDVVMDRIRWSMALFANGNGEAFGRNLEAQAEVAAKTGSADVFRANLEFYRKASAKFPDCMRKLEEFERTPLGVALSQKAEARGVPVSVLKSLVMTPAELAKAEPDTLRALAANPRVARTLRNEARRALEGPAAPVAPVAPAPITPAGSTPRR